MATGGMAAAIALTPVINASVPKDAKTEAKRVVSTKILAEMRSPSSLASLKLPNIETSSWHSSSQSAKKIKSAIKKEVSYTISTKGNVRSNLVEFSKQVSETLNDSRGWSRIGVVFREVTSGGDFDLILSQAELLPTFSSGCDAEWSCRVGKSVIINDNRWSGATTAWNDAGGDMRNYRHMVINHEVGHWLGHGHLNCSGANNPAAVMQQQSIDLQGCAFNPWPLDSELWSTTLGIVL
ncbi:membrane protein [Candidatus Nanosynbacter lyticus]|uniref:Membrane protein n=1 Tax=Candidatus Nanosynbacter lyticus TaxID=2093824 RepID=A0A6S4GQE0_9BACT|nr:membrane protein [Candidatus Nanosynbacter lyticus]QCT41857.1 DUF3152 domain-containing protein [TM7 phylum sp. oral taxon 952]